MATDTSRLQVNIFDGTRQPIQPGVRILMTIFDGNNNQIVREYYPSGQAFQVPFYDNSGDDYRVLAFADGYSQAGFVPVKCSPQAPQSVDIMLLRRDPSFNFADAKWDVLATNNPLLYGILAQGAANDDAALDRYTELIEDRPAVLACLLNITT